MIRHVLRTPPIDPAAPAYPVDSTTGRPLYANPTFYETTGCIGIDGATPAAVANTVHLIELAQVVQQLLDLNVFAAELFEGRKGCKAEWNIPLWMSRLPFV